MARTQSTLHQLLHLLQHLASQRGLHINPDKCQLLRLNSNLPICLSHSTSPTSCCSCCFCCNFTTLPQLKTLYLIHSRWWTRQSTSELWSQPITHPMQMWLTAALRPQPPSAVFFLFSRALRFIQKGSSRFMPKSLWQSYYMVPNRRSYAKFSNSPNQKFILS